MNICDKALIVDKDASVAPSASVISDVQVGRGSSIWYGYVLRGKVLCVQSLPLTQIRVVNFTLLAVATDRFSNSVI